MVGRDGLYSDRLEKMQLGPLRLRSMSGQWASEDIPI